MHHHDCEDINLNISLNIQGMILLANPDPTTDGITAEAAELIGILPDPEDDSSQMAAGTSEEDEAI